MNSTVVDCIVIVFSLFCFANIYQDVRGYMKFRDIPRAQELGFPRYYKWCAVYMFCMWVLGLILLLWKV